MAKQTLNFGQSANDGTGDSLRDGGLKIQANFDELYADAHFVAPADVDAASVNSAITSAQTDGARLKLPAGDYSITGSIVLWDGSGTVGPTQGFTLIGNGKLHNFASQYGGTALGTILRMAPGTAIDTNGARSVVLEDLAIIGSNDDVLFDGENAFENGGGLRRVYIENQSNAAGATVVRTGAMFTSNTHHADIVGDSQYRTKYNGAGASAGMFNTVGFEFDGTGKGAGGVPVGWNLHGHELGMRLGLTAAEYAGVPGDKPKIENWSISESQISYCNRGAFAGSACVAMTFHDQHWEYNTDYHLKVASGAGSVFVFGGQSAGLGRATGEEMRDGQFVIGDPNLSEAAFKRFTIERHNISYVGQAGLLIHGGGGGDIVVRDCFSNTAGGIFIAVNAANGVPNIHIDGFLGTAEPAHTPFQTGRFIKEVTPQTDYSLHTEGLDARWMARIENSGVYGDDIPLNGNLDLATQKYAPVACTVNTNRTVTLGDAPPIGWPTTLIKTSGAISLVVPNGTALYQNGAEHTGASGSATLNLTANGNYTLTRLGGGIWTCEGRALP